MRRSAAMPMLIALGCKINDVPHEIQPVKTIGIQTLKNLIRDSRNQQEW